MRDRGGEPDDARMEASLASLLTDIIGWIGKAIGLVFALLSVLGVVAWAIEEIHVRSLVRRGTLQRVPEPNPRPAVLSPWHGIRGAYMARGRRGREIVVIRHAVSNIPDGSTEDGDDYFPSYVVAIAQLLPSIASFHLPGPGRAIDWRQGDEVDPTLLRRLPSRLRGGIIVHEGWMAYYANAGRPDRIAVDADSFLGGS